MCSTVFTVFIRTISLRGGIEIFRYFVMLLQSVWHVWTFLCDCLKDGFICYSFQERHAVQSKVLRFAQPVLIRPSLYHCNYPYSASGRITPPVFHFSAEQASIDFWLLDGLYLRELIVHQQRYQSIWSIICRHGLFN